VNAGLEKMTKEQIAGVVKALAALAETIRELKEVPSGVLYSHVMGALSHEAYASAIRTLKNAGLVEERNNVLRWVGPELVK